GDIVRIGHVVGGLGNEAIAAPATGVLLGLAARGARIEPGDELVEVDPSGIPYCCHGIGDEARTIAANVSPCSRAVVSLPRPTRGNRARRTSLTRSPATRISAGAGSAPVIAS